MHPELKLHSPVDVLQHSPLLRGLSKTLTYAAQNGGIGLTKSYALNRKFVHWAADNFEWPEYTSEDLFIVNKVLNEDNMPPLWPIHDLLLHFKLMRRYKGHLKLTKLGQGFLDNPTGLFNLIAPVYLFRYDHNEISRTKGVLLGHWDLFLNIINFEVRSGCSLAHLIKTFYGFEEPDGYDPNYSASRSDFRLGVVRPLCWLGLLWEDREGLSFIEEGMLYKTPLWTACLKLDTDTMKPDLRVV
jgi:hypothetical protein